MQGWHSKSKLQCGVCYPKSEEVVGLMYRLLDLVLKQHQKLVDRKTLPIENFEDKQQGAVEKLIKFIFNEKLPAQLHCKHPIVQQFLVLKTKLPKRQVNFICESIYQFQAKRNYEIEVLISQVKCFPRSIIEDLFAKSKQPSSRSEKEELSVKIEAADMQPPEAGDQKEPQLETSSPPTPIMSFPYYYPYYIQAIPSAPFAGFYSHMH